MQTTMQTIPLHMHLHLEEEKNTSCWSYPAVPCAHQNIYTQVPCGLIWKKYEDTGKVYEQMEFRMCINVRAKVHFNIHCQIIYLIKYSFAFFCLHIRNTSYSVILCHFICYKSWWWISFYFFSYIPKNYIVAWYSSICQKEKHWSIAVNKNEQQQQRPL